MPFIRYHLFQLFSSATLHRLLLSSSLWIGISIAGWGSDAFNPRSLVALPKEVVTGTLPNGLRYVLMPNAQPSGRAEIRLVINVGSAAESDQQRGHAHFLEHLAFGGTLGFPQRTMVKFWEEQGMKFGQDINAMTGYDRTVYQTAVPSRPDSLKAVLASLPMVAEWLDKLSIDSQKVESEKTIIQEEIRAYDAGDDFFDLKHGSGRYARLPIGTADEVKSTTAASLREFYDQWYAPHRATLIVVGAIDVAQLQSNIVEIFGKIPRKSQRGKIPPFKYDKGVQVMELHDAFFSGAKADIIVPHRMNQQQTMGDALALQRGKLLILLAERRLRALGMRVTLSDGWYLGNIHHFTASVSAQNEEALRDSLQQISAALRQMLEEGWCSPELRAAKQQFAERMRQKNPERPKTSSALCDDFIDFAAVGDRYIADSLQWQQLIGAVEQTTSADLQRMLRQWLRAAKQTLLVAVQSDQPYAGKSRDKNGTFVWTKAWEAGQKAQRPQYVYKEVEEIVPNEVIVPKEISEIPTYNDSMIVARKHYPGLNITEARLKNGLRIVLKPTPSLDSLIHVSVIAPYGTANIPAEKSPLLESTAGYIDMGGTRTLPAEALADFQMSHGITLITSLEQHWHGFLGQTATQNSPLFYNFLREKWQHPELRYQDFEEARRDELASLGKETVLSRMLQRSPEHLLNQKMDEWAGRVLPQPKRVVDSVELQRLTLDDIAAFYHQLYDATEQTTLIVTGNFETAQELTRLAAAFSPLPRRAPLVWPQPLWTAPTAKGEEWLKLPETTATTGELLHIERLWSGTYEPGLRASLVLKLMRDALRQRVIQMLREKEGLVYSPYVALFYDAAPWSRFLVDVSLTAKPNNLPKIQQLLEAIETDLAKTPLSEAELSQLKRPFLIAKNDELPPDDAAAWRTALERLTKNNESLEDFDRYEEVLQSIRPSDVQRAFQTLIQQRHWLLLTE